jgi:hypothetical protein
VLLGGGPALIITGFLIGNGKDASFSGAGVVIGAAGFLSMVGSIPLFIASRRNKRKAKDASVYLQLEKIPVIQQTGMGSHSYYRAVSVKFNLQRERMIKLKRLTSLSKIKRGGLKIIYCREDGKKMVIEFQHLPADIPELPFKMASLKNLL